MPTALEAFCYNLALVQFIFRGPARRLLLPANAELLDWGALLLVVGLTIYMYLAAYTPNGRRPFDYPKLSSVVAGVLGLAMVLSLLARPGGPTVRLVALGSIAWLVAVVCTYVGFRKQNQVYEQGRDSRDN